MKPIKGIVALSVAGLLAIGGTALAAEATTTAAPPIQSTQDPTTDPTGVLLLGVDISKAGNTPDAVKSFVAGLSPDQQTGVTNGCGQVLTSGAAGGNTVVLDFCKNLTG